MRTLAMVCAAVVALASFAGSKDMPKAKTEYPIRKETNKFVTLETNMGKMTLELYHDVAPVTVDSFLSLTKKKFYDGTVFHRIIDNFMIQGGDPTGTGAGGPGYSLKAEFSDLPHQEGTVSMARTNDPNSAGSQFFICLAPAKHLDGKYTIFGQVVNGLAVLHKIGKVPVGPGGGGEKSSPLQKVEIVKAYISDAAGNPVK